MRALLELMAALRGTVTVALVRVRARPRLLVVGAGLGVAALALGAAQLVVGDPDGLAGDGRVVRDVPERGLLPPPGDGSVPGSGGRPLVAGLNEAPVAPPRSGGADPPVAVGLGGTEDGPGTGEMVGTGAGGSGSAEPGAGWAAGGGTVPSSMTDPPGTDTTAPPGTTATTAAPDPGGGLQGLLSLLGPD